LNRSRHVCAPIYPAPPATRIFVIIEFPRTGRDIVGSVAIDNFFAARTNPGPCPIGKRRIRIRARFRTETNHLKSGRRPKILNVIKHPLQHCDKSPTQEAEPNDHHRYDQGGKEVDRDFPARFRRRQSGLDCRILRVHGSLEIIHSLLPLFLQVNE
jgi:hypothetical protein